uniref:Uncharacterized protein n=1 Tax=Meloidogyne enterolobii TaxID=390850 RepID=A0A6V7UHH7_MELEN|nr:unnamed protein product [Meloidogyne enterolobii]
MLYQVLFKSSNLLFAASYAYTLYFDYHTEVFYNLCPVPGFYLSKFVWLTFINLNLHLIYNTLAAIIALFGLSNSIILNGLHFIATSLIFPVGLTVTVLFWALVYLDPQFLLDKEAEILMSSPWFNHCLHTLPLLTMTIDFLLWRHSRPTWKSAFIIIYIFMIAYLIDIHYFYYFYNFWAYPILGILSLPRRIFFIILCIVVLFASFLVTDAYNRIIHFILPKQRGTVKKLKKK